MTTGHATETSFHRIVGDRYPTHRDFANALDRHETIISRWCRFESIPHRRTRKEILVEVNRAGKERGLDPVTEADIWGDRV